MYCPPASLWRLTASMEVLVDSHCPLPLVLPVPWLGYPVYKSARPLAGWMSRCNYANDSSKKRNECVDRQRGPCVLKRVVGEAVS